MSLWRRLVSAATWAKHRRFVWDAQRPEAARARVWRETWSLVGGSPFWSRHSCRSPRLEDHEVSEYEDYRPALERSFLGTHSELSGEPILFWSESSGTSGRRKIFPITPTYQRQFQATTPPLIHSWAQRFPGFMANPVLYFAATLPAERSLTGIEVGFISNFNYRHISPLLRRRYAFPVEVFRDTETFFRWGPLYALATDLSAMVAITPSMLLQFAQRIEAGRDSFWEYLEGRTRLPAPLPPLSVSPDRLATLRRALASTPIDFREVWPGLQFVCCWKTSTCGLQLPRLQPHLRGDVPVVDATYSATEGWINVPLGASACGGPVHPGAHVFEFLRVGDAPERANLRQAWELEEGGDYEIFLTTAMGFVRYRLHDVVRCTGYFHRSPIIEFVQKAGSLLSLGQARIREAVLLAAMAKARWTPTGRWFFGPHQDGAQLVFYCEQPVPGAKEAMAVIEQAVRDANPDYAADVDSGLLRPVGVVVLPPDHAAWSAGPTHAQAKPAALRQTAPDSPG